MHESWDRKWEQFYQQSNGNQYPDACIVRFVAKNYYSRKNRRKIHILDLGCGSGSTQWYLCKEGFTTFGIDASKTAIKKSRKRLQIDNLKADLRVGDFTTLPYLQSSMDAIIDAASIQHNRMNSIKKIILEIYRVLKKGGKFYGMLIAKSNKLSCADYATHVFKVPEIKSLFAAFRFLSIDYLEYTEANQTKSIKFWLVEATK